MANTANISSLSVLEINSLLANSVSNSSLTTDFNVTPYYDDYSADKNFYKILFKPGYAVQARELTQAQTILQKQIDRFGRHVFREGSIVIPGQFGIELNTDYVKIKDIDNSNNSINVNDFLNQTITGLTNGVTAYVIDVADGTETETDTKTLFVRYTSSGSSNTAINKFAENEILTANTETPFNAVALSSSATGKGSRFIIQEGVVFAKEHFIRFPTSSVILSRYSINPTCRVGFNVTEDIVTANEDASLLDPALESSNYSAPGADRFRLTPTLKVLDINDNTGYPNFVELFTINEGVITELYNRPQYNIVKDELAKRTSDESGDYYVNGLSVRVREHLNTNVNDGYLISSKGGNNSLLAVGVEPGVAYVKGYEVGIIGNTYYLTTEKSATYQNVSSQTGAATMGDYLKCNEYVGNIEHDKGTIVFLRDTANRRLSTYQGASVTGLGNTIGTARVLTVDYNAGLLGTPSGNVDIYLTDIRMNGTNSFASTKAVVGTNFAADVILENGFAVLKETASRSLLYYTGTNYTRTIRNSAGSPSMQFSFKRTVSGVSISSTGTFSVPISTTGETFPYGTVSSNLSEDNKRDIIITIDNDANISGPVGATVSNSGPTTVTGTAGARFTFFNIGDKVKFSGNSKAYTITAINSNTSMNVSEVLPQMTANLYFKAYLNGDVIDLTSKSFDDGSVRVVTTTPTQLTIDLNETFGGSGVTGKITYRAIRSGGESALKTLRDNRYVIINCATAGTTGPFNLGFSDVYRIRNVIKKTGSAPASLSDGTDISANFTLDNGQRDNMYDHGTITPRGITLGATDYLLVRLDYFTPGTFSGGKGFFSIDSYPINDSTTSNTSIRTENVPVYVSPQSGSKYDLRNYIDFRPVKAATATDATTVGSATTNPARSSDFSYDTDGLRLVAPSSSYSYSYSYYESRRDLVVVDKDKNISVIKSNPGQSPVTPPTPENTMALATIFVAPYPSLAPNYAQLINRKDLSCVIKKVSNIRYTMRDIGVLERRIENLEYYASLTLLEKAAIDLRILDENGLDRFKNGIFVDTFADHSLGDRANRDYRIVVDQFEKTIRPIYTMGSINYDYSPSGSGLVKTGDLITLPYTQNAFISQPRVTTYRNIEFTSYRFIGTMYLSPETDLWVDTLKAPDEQITIGPDANNLPQTGLTTVWNAWQTNITGYNLAGSVSRFGQVRPAESLTPAEFSALLQQNLLITSPNSPADQEVTEFTTSVRTGTETYVSGVTETTETIGTKVLDVSLIPYIRPQTIYVGVRGLKANTNLYTFFDGEDMTDYVSQITSYSFEPPFDWNPSSNTNIDSNEAVSMNPPALGIVVTKPEGSPLVTDTSGSAYFALRLPKEKTFRVGTKEVRVSDSPTNSITDATTAATAYFVSQGLVQQKQNTVLTTRKVIQSQREVTETVSQSKVIGYIDRPSCTAYSFIPKAPEGEEGIFLTSVDLYFARKHPTLGVWVEVREMDSSGGITRNQVPLSEIWYTADQINVSDDASVPTNFKFRSPIFLYNNVQYAFVIHTVGLNPDSYLWIARLGETDIKTGTKHNSRPLTGTYYTTNNNLNWDIVPDIDLLITFYRAKFTTGTTGSAVLTNRPIEKLILGNVSSALTNYGEKLLGRSRLTLTGNTSTINVGDYLVGQTSGANSAVISNTSPVIVANTRYVTGERLDIRNNLGALKPQTTVVTSLAVAGGTLSTYAVRDGVTTVELTSSNGKFILGDTLTGQASGYTATVDGIANSRYSLIDFEPTYLSFNKTVIAFDMQTTSNTGVPGAYGRINDSSNYYFDEEKALLSRTYEVSALGGGNSNNVRISMSSTTDFMSPVLDLSRTHSVYVDNLVNANTTGESANSSGGGLLNKYISQIISLAEGQDAEDLSVILTAYRPPTTDVKVYVKILQGEDGELFANQKWIEMEKVDDTAFSSLSNRNDFREFYFKFPDSQLTGPNGEVQYTNINGTTYTGFKYYQVKIGLTATNSAIVPRVGDLRTIALQL